MKKQNESGRSMVEILGVLAIIGVLSITGIAGFRSATNKYRANETIQRLMRRAIAISIQRQQGQAPDLSAFNENDGTYPIPATGLEIKDTESFSLLVNDVPQDVCEKITNLNWKMAKMSDCNDTTLKFKFLNDLSDCSECVLNGFDCTPYGNECGKCTSAQGYMPNESACVNSANGPYCVLGRCATCQDGKFYRNGCLACNANGNYYPNSIEATKYNCLGDMFWAGMMYGCKNQDTAPGNADEFSCKQCANRCFLDGACWPAGVDGRFKRNPDGTCLSMQTNGVTVLSCEGRYVYRPHNSLGYRCVSCQNFDNYYYGILSPLDKHNCLGDMFWADNYFANDTRGSMLGCIKSDAAVSNADEKSCKACANRCYLDGTCYWFGEGKSYLYKDAEGNCTNTNPN